MARPEAPACETGDHSFVDVSVIVAACNAQEFLGEALRSALAQADVEVEILVVDDASTDRTAQIVEFHARRDPRIRLIRSDRRRGPGAARNLALDQSKGEWIAVLDADDRYEVDRLASLLAIAREWNADMVADNLWLVDTASKRPFDLMFPANRLPSPQLVSAEAFVRNNNPQNIKRKFGLLKPIMRRRFINQHDLRYNEDTYLGEDFLFYLECLVLGARFVLVPEAYYFYGLAPASLTRTRSLQQVVDFLDHCETFLQREEVSIAPALARALVDHSKQLRADLVYLRFSMALKRGRFIGASGVIASRPQLMPYIVRHSIRVAAFRCRQWIAGIALSGMRIETGQTVPLSPSRDDPPLT